MDLRIVTEYDLSRRFEHSPLSKQKERYTGYARNVVINYTLLKVQFYIRGQSFTTLGTGAGYSWWGYENYSKEIEGMKHFGEFFRGYEIFLKKVNFGENQFNEMQKQKHLSKVNYSKLTSQLDTVDGHKGMKFFLICQWGIKILEKVRRGVNIFHQFRNSNLPRYPKL